MTRFSEEWYARRIAAQGPQGGTVQVDGTAPWPVYTPSIGGDLPGAEVDPPVYQPTPPIPYERDVLSAILGYMPLCKRVAWAARMNTGGMQNAAGQYVAFGFPGLSDIIGQLTDGRFLAIECKRPGKTATAEQWQFLCNVNRNNGVGFVAVSVDDVRAQLG